MGNEDLGKHLEAIGDLNGAAEAYSKMRPDVSTNKHLIDVCKYLVRVSLQRREWNMVSAHLNKLPGTFNSQEDETGLQPYVKIAQGIAYLGQESFLEAAMSFLSVYAAIPSTTYNEIATHSDVAVYGGLLALACMDRKTLQTKVLDNSMFRNFLEHEPHIRRAISQFVNGRYSACIATLEAHRADYLLDIYLQKHIPMLYSNIRRKCIDQYLIPFSCVKLETMEKAFGSPSQPIEEELVEMIRTGKLHARINTIDKVSLASQPCHGL
jgi:COP9 signalosome complex subunit 1